MTVTKGKELVGYVLSVLGVYRVVSLSISSDFCASVLDGTIVNPANDGDTCRLHQYRTGDVVECLDIMQTQAKTNNSRTQLVFFGDSRIRQHFILFKSVRHFCL